jgi:acyl-CoA synthetase (AMP-forming)/AMP-acid ligase II
MADQNSGTRSSVGLLDIASRVPGLILDAPTIVRGVVTGFGARPSAKTSIGKVFQDTAARHGDKLFLKYEDREISYREANETVNRYAAVLAARGVGRGDVVGIMLRNSPEPVMLMLAAVKCGAISGMLNYNQRGDVLEHSLGLLSATVVVADPDFVDPIKESGADTDAVITLDEFQRRAETAPTPVAFVEYDEETGDPVRDEKGRVKKVKNGEPGLLLSKVSNFQPFDGYTDEKESEKKLVRDAFKEGDVWFNTGDLMRSQGFGHAAFTDRLGDTFRWKGENVATTEVEAAVSTDPQVEECTAFGVEVPDTGGKAGMVAIQLKEGQEFDGKSLAKAAYDKLPSYAVPLFVRVVEELAHTSTFKSQKVDLRKEGYGGSSGEGDDDDVKVEDPIYVLSGPDEGYVPFYDEYLTEVKDGKKPK